MIGGRNAHDRSISFAQYGGASIWICSNLMVSAKFEDRRKHMGDMVTELPELGNTSIDRVLRDNTINRKRISHYKKESLRDQDAYYFMVEAMKKDILGPSKIKHLVKQWEKPLHEEFSSKNAWSLHNCFTEIFKDLTSADLVYHRNTVLNGMLDDFTGFDKPIIDITPPKEEVVEVKPPSLDGFEGNLKENLEVCQEVIVKAKPIPKPKAKPKVKAKAKPKAKAISKVLYNLEEDLKAETKVKPKKTK